jgi:hypothetical protein
LRAQKIFVDAQNTFTEDVPAEWPQVDCGFPSQQRRFAGNGAMASALSFMVVLGWTMTILGGATRRHCLSRAEMLHKYHKINFL